MQCTHRVTLLALFSSPSTGHTTFDRAQVEAHVFFETRKPSASSPSKSSSPTHPHPLTHDGSSSPSLTVPRLSARVTRRSSLFMNSNDYDEEEEALEHPEASCATAEAGELSSAEVDGSFERGVRPEVEGAESVTEA